MRWTKEKHNFLINLVQLHGRKWKKIAEEMTKQFDEVYTDEQCRSRWRNHRHEIKQEVDPKEQYGVKMKRNEDGSIEDDRLIAISKEQLKDDNYILQAHGYDDSWEIVSHQFSVWMHHNKQDGTKTLYASKIRVKPKHVLFSWDKFERLLNNIPNVNIKPKTKVINADYLLLPLFDMHFGISDYEYYIPTQSKILHKLDNNYKKVVLIFGQDAFHNDDFHGRTVSGRQIDKVDMVQAWKDATLFFEPIIKKALENNSDVEVIYSKGNHSETVEWAFVQYLKARFPQCEFDDSLKERKVTMLGKNFIGTNHGDKKNEKRLPENFATEFPIEWSKANTRTIFTGHRHSELVEDAGGVLVRRMPTRNKVDDWHDDMGYTTAHKRFQIHEFSEDEQVASYYV